MEKKLISVCVPVYNEEKNLQTAYTRITAVMRALPAYDYEIVFFDDCSTDGSAAIIEELCAADEHVKAVFYSRNYGYTKTVFYCLQQAKGDAAIIVHCDLQNPPEEIPRFIEKWEQGADVVQGIKNKSKENKLMYFLRTVAYFIMNFVFGMHMVPHATEFELVDRSFIDTLRDIRTQNPYLRGLLHEYGRKIDYFYYTQDKRREGKSHFRLRHYYEFAAGGIVSMSKCLPRRMILFSVIAAILLLLEFFIHYLPAMLGGMESTLLWNGILIRFGILLLLLMLMLLSLMFEYIITVSKNVERKPFITELKRIRY